MKGLWNFNVSGHAEVRYFVTAREFQTLNEVVNNRTHEHWAPEGEKIEKVYPY
jgi:hypothetical protein